MVFCVFIFIFVFRNNVIREQLGQNNFRRCYGFFSRKHHSKITWSQRCLKFSINNYEAPSQQHLKDTVQLKISWRSLSSLHQDIKHIFACFSFSQTIEQFLPQFIYFSIFWYCILKFFQYLHAFLKTASNFSWASMLCFCESSQLQNVIIFLFSIIL